MVTHDRWFLDAVCTRDLGGRTTATVDPYDGGYAAYVLARAERDRQASATEEQRQNLLRKELAWLRRGAPARTSKPKFRIDAANALIADEPPPRDQLEPDPDGDRPARQGRARPRGRRSVGVRRAGSLLDDVTWRLGPGDRVGLVGVNGAGKTTLLRLLTGELQPDRRPGQARQDRAGRGPDPGRRGARPSWPTCA